MALLKLFKCKDCNFEFSDLPPDAGFFEIGNINPVTGALENKKPIPQECPECAGQNIEPVMENGQQKNA